MTRPSSRWRPLLVALAVLAGAVALQLALRGLAAADQRPVPWLAALPWLVAGGGFVLSLAAAVMVMRRVEGRLAKLGAATLHGLVALAGLAGVVASDPAFPFGPAYTGRSLARPDGHGTAYLYEGGLFCSQTVWRTGPSPWWSTRDVDAGAYTCEREGQLAWDAAQGRVVVVGHDGEPLPAPDGWDGLAEGLDWRPH